VGGGEGHMLSPETPTSQSTKKNAFKKS